MTWLKQVRVRDDQKRQEQALRTKGYDDGYNRRPASLRNAVYQTAWRHGRQAREQDELTTTTDAWGNPWCDECSNRGPEADKADER